MPELTWRAKPTTAALLKKAGWRMIGYTLPIEQDRVETNAVLKHPSLSVHEHLGEIPALFVVKRGGQDIEAQHILNHWRGRLSAFKVPFSVHFVDEIPRTGSAKILRLSARRSPLETIGQPENGWLVLLAIGPPTPTCGRARRPGQCQADA